MQKTFKQNFIWDSSFNFNKTFTIPDSFENLSVLIWSRFFITFVNQLEDLVDRNIAFLYLVL